MLPTPPSADPLPAAQDLWDTLIAVLNVVGYTDEFAQAHPDLTVSQGVRLLLAEKGAPAQTPKFDQEWGLVLALCRCGILSKSEATTHQVSRLAKFYGDSPRGDVLREMLVRKDGPPFRLVRSEGGAALEGTAPVARVVETWRYGPRGRENVRKSLRWFATMEDFVDGTELYAVAPAPTIPHAPPAND